MTPPSFPGSHPLTGTAKLPNVQVAFPGEHWSDWSASGEIVPGSAIFPAGAAANGRGAWRVAEAADPVDQIAIAKRVVEIPDTNIGPGALGPNEIVNQTIADGDYVHAYESGAFHLTLVVPGSYAPGDRIAWQTDGVRPADKAAGTGAWAVEADADTDALFEVQEVREVGTNDEVILTVRSLRGQF